MTALVTGATGRVGRHVVDQLAQTGRRVRILTRDPAATVEEVTGRAGRRFADWVAEHADELR